MMTVDEQNAWKSRVGSNPWRGLIYEECEAARSPDVSRATPTSVPSSCGYGYRLGTEAERKSSAFRYCRIAPGSFLVFQAGRLFVVGPMILGSEPLLKVARDEVVGTVCVHVILLSWREEEIAALQNLKDRRGDNKKLTVWTSDWIWEEVLSNSSRNTWLRGLDRLCADDARLRDESVDLSEKAITFEEHLDLRLALGVHIGLDYTVAREPSLRAHFACNHLHLVLDPLGVEPEKLKKIRKTVESTTQALPPLRNEFAKRLMSTYDPPACSDSCSHVRTDENGAFGEWFLPGITNRSPDDVQLHQPIDLGMTNKALNTIKFAPNNNKFAPNNKESSRAQAGDTNDSESICPERLIVAIMCGRLSAIRHRELLDPGRMLEITNEVSDAQSAASTSTNGAKQSKKVTTVMSILEMRLREIDQWFEKLKEKYCVKNSEASAGSETEGDKQTNGANENEGPKMPVLLLTSPDTHEIALQHRTSLQGELRHIAIEVLPHQLVPLVTNKEGEVVPCELPDGGWQLDARGHMDMLRVLRLFMKLEGRKYAHCFAFSYNNLGDFFSETAGETTYGNLSKFAQKPVPLAVEVFLITRGRQDDDERLKQLSYAQTEEKQARDWAFIRLLKSPHTQALDLRTCSAHTWYVKLSYLNELEKNPQYTFPGWEKEDGAPVTVFPRLDMDQVSHEPEPKVAQIFGCGVAVPNTLPLYSYSRFLVVRREDQLISKEFQDILRERTLTLSNLRPMNLQSVALAESVPAERQAVWGGPNIALLKGQPPRVVAETWEISTHSAGPSLVALNTRDRVPLSVFLENRRERDTEGVSQDSFPYMLKYLDCNAPLSIQVHPDDRTAEYLARCCSNWTNVREGGGSGEHFAHVRHQTGKDERWANVRDDGGKEESFFVCQEAPVRGLHLFVGFNRDELRPIAGRLRSLRCRDTDAGALILRKLQEAIYAGFVQGIDDVFGAMAPERLLREHFCEAFVGDERDRFLEVLAYHFERRTEDFGQSSLFLLDSEYLLAAIGLIRAIQVIVDYVHKNPKVLDKARGLFCREGVSLKSAQNSPILRLFHRQEVAKGQWCRIPPGTVHSWQGGGNLLVEIADKSDNTFRILDFGRELENNTKRDMHYWEAMYALSPHSIVDPLSAERFCFDAQEGRRCHGRLGHFLYRGMDVAAPRSEAESSNSQASEARSTHGGQLVAEIIGAWSVILNPDNPLRLRVSAEADEAELSVRRYRAVLIAPNKKVMLFPRSGDDRILHIYPRKEDAPLVCLSLGGTRAEVALWRDGGSGGTDWRLVTVGSSAKMLEAAVQEVRSLIHKHGLQNHVREGNIRVAVTWPGHVHGGKLYSSALSGYKDVTELEEGLHKAWDLLANCDLLVSGDAEISALGEHWHPQGGLAGWDSGMVLNLGTGLCAGFYLGSQCHIDAVDRTTSHGNPGLSPIPPGHSPAVNGAATSVTGGAKEREEKKHEEKKRQWIVAVGAVGRWLYVDRDTHRIVPFGGSRGLNDAVYQREVPLAEQYRVRTSAYLSNRGLTLRLLHRVPTCLRQILLNEIGWGSARTELEKVLGKAELDFVEGCRVLDQLYTACPRHALFQRLNTLCENGEDSLSGLRGLLHAFVVEVAVELADVVRQIRCMCDPEITGEVDGVDEHLRKTMKRCTERIVLTGSVGVLFGRIAWGGSGTDEKGGHDLLIDTMNRALRSTCVRRSEIAVAAVREIEGFLFELSGQNARMR